MATDRSEAVPVERAKADEVADTKTDEALARGLRAARFIAPVAFVAGAAVAGVLIGTGTAILILAAGAILLVIALLWSSVQSLTGESELTLDEALSLTAPSAEEEQKRAVLRALHDLEYERSVGKISEEDYAVLSQRYRAEAKRLLRILDAGMEGEMDRAKKALAKRLEKEGLAEELAETAEKPTEEERDSDSRESSEAKQAIPGDAPDESDDAPTDVDDDGKTEADDPPTDVDDGETEADDPPTDVDDDADDDAPVDDEIVVCPECGTENDDDAVFCKKCGAKLRQS